MKDTMETWLNMAHDESDAQWKFWEFLQMEQARMDFEWDDYLKSYIKNDFDLNGSGLLITGPDGCGKHTAARRAVWHLLERSTTKPFNQVLLNGLLLEASSAGEAINRLGSLVDDFDNANVSLCLVMDGLEDHPFRQKILTFLGRKLRDHFFNGEPEMFLILIDRSEETIPQQLRSQLKLFRMDLPNVKQREHIIEQYGEHIKQRVSFEEMAKNTEGFSCIQLRDLVHTLRWTLSSRGESAVMTNEELKTFCRSQLPAPNPENAVVTLARSVQQLMDKLPQMLQNLPAQGQQMSAAQQQLQQNNSARIDERGFLAAERKRIQELPPKALAEETYGKKFVEDVISGSLQKKSNADPEAIPVR